MHQARVSVQTHYFDRFKKKDGDWVWNGDWLFMGGVDSEGDCDRAESAVPTFGLSVPRTC